MTPELHSTEQVRIPLSPPEDFCVLEAVGDVHTEEEDSR